MIAAALALLLAGIPMTSSTSAIQSASGWTVVAVRGLEGRQATARLPLAEAPLNPDSPPHARLAGALAWHELADQALAEGDVDLAIEAARRGIDELGRRYADPLAVDDTGQKLKAAEYRIEQGEREAGARQLVGILQARIEMYRALHGL